MKVAIVFDGLQVGGIEKVGLTYIKLFQNLGYEVTVVNLDPKLNELEPYIDKRCKVIHTSLPRKLTPEQYAQLIKQFGVGRFIYPIFFFLLSIVLFFYKIALKLANKNYRENYDLVIAFSGHFNDLTFVAKGFMKASKKICWLHGTLYGYLLISDGFVNLYKKIKNLIVLSDDAQDETLSYNRKLKLTIYKLYNPIDFSDKKIDLRHVKNLKEQYGKFVLMVGRFEYPKDQKMVIDAVRILIEQYGICINLVFAGTGSTENDVRNYAQSLDSIKDNIFFAGNRMDIQDYYLASHLLVHSSKYEGLPTVLLESMKMGKPVVTTNSKSGAVEIIKDNKYGLLCEVGNAADMAEKIKELLKDDGKYEHYKSMGMERIKDFEPNRIKQQLEEIIYSLKN